jgi:drug/metabolite transporter (DMT)-like permease
LTLSVLGLVLVAALTHALWNAWLKVSGDRLITLATIATGWAIVGLSSLPFVGIAHQDAWPYLLASTLLHALYSLTLIWVYSLAALSTAYPIARGTAPLIVAVVSAVFLGESLGAVGFAAVTLIVIGVVWIGARPLGQDYKGLILSLFTGGLIGAYTLVDGLGGRIGGSPHGFAASLLSLTAILIVLFAGFVHRGEFAAMARPLWLRGIGVGVLSAGAYWVVIWAMSVAPMGLVAAVRESSVVFAAVIGGALLKERVRWAAVVLVFCGVVLTSLT